MGHVACAALVVLALCVLGLPSAQAADPAVYPAVQRRTVPESGVTEVGLPIEATDADGDITGWAVVAGDTGSQFTISATGQVVVASSLDFETATSYNLTLEVTDATAGVGTGYVEIEVTDVNDAPVFGALPTLTVAENSVATTVVSGGSMAATDEDTPGTPQTLTFSITAGNTGDAFAIGASSGELSVLNAVLDFETTPSYTLTIRVTDNGSPVKFAETDVTVSVTDENDAPTATDKSITIGEHQATAVVLTGANVGAADEDTPGTPQTLSYAITGGDPSSQFSVASNGDISLASSLDFEALSSYTLTVTVSDDGTPVRSTDATVTVTVTDENDVPTMADASASVGELTLANTAVPYTLTVTEQDAGQTVSYAITGGNTGPAFAMDSGTGALSVADPSTLDFETTTSYSLEVTVTDDATPTPGSSTATITVTITDENDAPAATDKSITIGEHQATAVVLTGANVGAADEDTPGTPQTLSYAITGGDPSSQFSVASNGDISLASSLDFEALSSYTLTVTVSDDGTPVRSTDATVTVTVTDENDVPVFTLPNPVRFVNESAGVGHFVHGGRVNATDEDVPAQTITFSIEAGNVGTAFAIDGATGDITVNGALDHETLNAYTLTIRATDDASPTPGFAELDVTVDVLSVNEGPSISDASGTVAELSPAATEVTVTITATDVDRHERIYFSIEAGNTDGAFAIDADTGTMTVVNAEAVDHEVNPTFTLTVRATDDGIPALSDEATVTITVTDVNDAPVITNVSPEVTLAEDVADGTAVVTMSATDQDAAPTQTLTWSITAGNDDGAFAISGSTGAITVTSVGLDHEAAFSRTLTVVVEDDGSPTKTDTTNVLVRVTDVNDRPKLPDVTRHVNESLAGFGSSVVGTLVGTALPGTDEDTDPVQTLAWSIITGNTGDVFDIDANGQITVAKAVLDFETTPTYTLTVQLQDNSTVTATDTTTATVTVQIGDLNDFPVVPSIQNRTIDENEPVGTAVTGGAVVASDVDVPAQDLSFTIVDGNTGGVFTIGSSTGVLTVATRALNYEATSFYELVIDVTDAPDAGHAPLTTRTTVGVTIVDVNDAPLLVDASRTIAERVPVGTVVSGGDIVATDEDGHTLTYTIEPHAVFEITAGGTFQTIADVDFETTTEYVINVTVTDDGVPPRHAAALATITVLDRNDPPLVSNVTRSIDEMSPVGTLVDGGPVPFFDNDATPVQGLVITIEEGNHGGAFAIEPSSGNITVALDILDHEAIWRYDLRVRVQDDGAVAPGPQHTDAWVTVVVRDVNDVPVFADGTRTVEENRGAGHLVLGGPVVAVDEDVDPVQTLTYSIVSGNMYNAFAIDGATGVLTVGNGTTLDYEAVPEYTLTLRATDNGTSPSALFADATFTVSVIDRNDAPVWIESSVLPGKDVDENVPAGTLVGTPVQATDADVGTVVSYAIVRVNNDGEDLSLFAVDASTGQLSVATPLLNYERFSSYTITINATDNGAPTGHVVHSTVDVEVRVTDINDRPVAVPPVGGSGAVNENAGVGINTEATVTVLDDDPTQTHTFTIMSGADGMFAIPDDSVGVIRVASLGLHYEAKNQYNITVRVTDNGTPALYDEIWVLVNINDLNEAPVFDHSNRTVDEGTPPGLELLPPLSDHVSDQDFGAVHKYSIMSGDPNGLFTVDPDTGVLSLAHGLNFEAKEEHVLLVNVTDNGHPVLWAVAEVAVFVTNINEVPTVLNTSRSVNENVPAGTTLDPAINATDPDSSAIAFGTLTYTVLSGNEAGMFAVDAATGVITVVKEGLAGLNHETTPSYELLVQVEDGGGLTDTGYLTINVDDINDDPIIVAQVRDVDENVPVGHLVGAPIPHVEYDVSDVVTYSITGGDTDSLFVIDASTGQLSVAVANVDHERQAQYNLTVRVTDDGVGALWAEAWVIVGINDVNEVPWLDEVELQVDEHSPVGTLIGSPLVAHDWDEDAPWSVVKFRIVGGNGRNSFAVDEDSGQLRQAVNNLDYEHDRRFHNLTIEVFDMGTPSLFSAGWVTITVVDINDAPIITDVGTRSVDENSAPGTLIGDVLAFSDQDNHTMAWAITADESGGFFEVDSSTGQLLVASGAALDFEARSWFLVDILVVDSGTTSLSDTAVINITVVDVNDDPIVTPTTMFIDEDAGAGAWVGNAVASDQDSGPRGVLEYDIIAGNDDGLWDIDPEFGVVTLTRPGLDFEAADTHTITVQATDFAPVRRSHSADVTVTVRDRNDVPVLTSITVELHELAPNVTFAAATNPFAARPAVPVSDEDTPGHPQKLVWDRVDVEAPLINATATFNVNQDGEIQLASGFLNYEAHTEYSLRVWLHDEHPAGDPATPLEPANQVTSVNITLAVIDDNEPTSLTTPSRLKVPEGSVVGTLIEGDFIIADVDDQKLDLMSSDTQGFFSFATPFSERNDDLTRNTVVLQVIKPDLPNGLREVTVWIVENNTGVTAVEPRTVIVDVADNNDAPQFTNVHISVNESSGAGTVLTLLQATDADPRQHLSYSVTSYLDFDNYFTTTAARGQQHKNAPTPAQYNRAAYLVMGADFLDYEAVQQFTIRVRVEDDGMVNDQGDRQGQLTKATNMWVEGTVTITVLDVLDIPVIEDVTPLTSFGMSTAGGEDVTITGINFGPLLPAIPGGVIDVNAQYFNDEVTFYVDACSVTAAFTEIRCKSRPGFGKGFQWMVQVGGQWSEPSNSTTDYALPNIARFSVPGAGPVTEFVTGGNELVTLHGTQFGTVAHNAVTRVTYGPTGTEYTAQLCNVTKSHSQITCLTTAGVGGQLLWIVEVGHQASETPTTSYGKPVITHVQGANMARTEGGQIVTINGTNLGSLEESPGSIDSVIYGRTDVPRLQWYKAVDCHVVTAHVAVQCLTAPGVGTEMRWAVAIQGQTSELAADVTEYGPPRIDSVQLVQESSGWPTKGDVRVTVRGANFGSAGDKRKVSFGTQFPELLSVVYVGHGELQFTLPAGNGVDKAVSIEVASQVSNVVLIDYDHPRITGMQHVSGSPPDAIVMDVFGANFGTCCVKRELAANPLTAPTCECEDVTPASGSGRRLSSDHSTALSTTVTINGSKCEALVLSDGDATLRCTTRQTGGDVVITAGGLVSPAFSYNYKDYLGSPFIDILTFSGTKDTQGGITVTIRGGSFGESGIVEFIAGDGLQEIVPNSYSDNTITFTLPEGQGLVPVRVSIMGKTRQSAPTNLEFDKPEITGVAGTSADTSGDAELQITGARFGQAKHAYNPLGTPPTPIDPGFENQVLVGGKNCRITSYSHTKITCKVPPGTGLNKTIELRVARLCSDCTPVYTSTVATGQFHYHGPQLSTLTPNHGPTVGDTLVSLAGSSLGSLGSPGFEILIGGIKVLDIVSHTHDLVKFRTRAGIGKNLEVRVTVDGQETRRASFFSYDPPEVHSVVNRDDLISGRYGECPAGEICLDRTFNAFKASLIITGRNFGTVSPDALSTSITVGGAPCVIAPGTSHVWVSDTRMECNLLNVRVGPKDIAINVSRQQAYVPKTSGLRSECKEGFYGIDSEPCLPCPVEGAYCPGQGFEPHAIAGYWRYNRTGFVQCQPLIACLGENKCSTGYREEGCTACVPGTYFRDLFTGLCAPCPSMAWMLLVGYMVGGMVLGLLFWKLYKKGPSVAAVGIAVDYFQILSIFADLNMGWPPSIVSVFEYASVTAANVEMTSPECSVSATYIEKWYFVMTLPIQMAFCMFLMHCAIMLRKFLCRKRGSKTKHVATMLGIYLVSLNYLFLFLTKKAFEALSCTRLSEGGPLFLAADPAVSCDSNEYLVMKQVAVLSIIAYGIGIPGIYCWLLFGNAGAIKVDQALRIRGLSGSRASNPYYDMQKKLRRLYFKFRPECYYWALVILARKFLIVVLSAEAGGKPMFAASATVLMLFGAYAAQMKMQPYRTHDPDKHDPYLDKLAGKDIESAHMAQWKQRRPGGSIGSAESDSDDGGIGTLEDARRAAERSVVLTEPRTFKRRGKKGAPKKEGVELRVVKRDTGAGVKIKTRYLYDYNMLESTFLCCAIFVLLAGMMFKSSEFEDGTPEYYAMEWGVLLIVFGSTIACILTVVAELVASLKYYRVAKKARKAMNKKYKAQAAERARRMSVMPSTNDANLTPLERRRRTIVAAAAQASLMQADSPKKGLRKKLMTLKSKFDRARKKNPNKSKRRHVSRHQLTLKFVMADDIDEEDGTPMRLMVRLDVQSDFMEFTYEAGVTTRARTVRLDVFDPDTEVVHIMLSTRGHMLAPPRVVGTASIPIKTTSAEMAVATVVLKDHRMRASGKLCLKAALRLRQPEVDDWTAKGAGVLSDDESATNLKGSSKQPMIAMPGMGHRQKGRAGAAAVRSSRQKAGAVRSPTGARSTGGSTHSGPRARLTNAPLSDLATALALSGPERQGAPVRTSSRRGGSRGGSRRGMVPHNMGVGTSDDSVFQMNPLAPKHLRIMGGSRTELQRETMQPVPSRNSGTGERQAKEVPPESSAAPAPATPQFHLNPIASKHLRVMGAAATAGDDGAGATTSPSTPRVSGAPRWHNPLTRSASGSVRSLPAGGDAGGAVSPSASANAAMAAATARGSGASMKTRVMRAAGRGARRSRGRGARSGSGK